MRWGEFKGICRELHMTQSQVGVLLGYSSRQYNSWNRNGIPRWAQIVLRLLDNGAITPDDIRRVNGLGKERVLDDDPVRRAQ